MKFLKLLSTRLFVIVFLSFGIVGCGKSNSEFSSIQILLPKEVLDFNFVVLVSDRSCKFCYDQINSIDKKSEVLILYFTDNKSGQKSIQNFDNFIYLNDYSVIQEVANITKNYKEPYLIKLNNGKITDIISLDESPANF